MTISNRLRAFFAALLFAIAPVAMADALPSTPDAKVFFVNLKDGDVVQSPFKIEFGISGMTIAKAGAQTPGTGHYHLLIDTVVEPADLTKPIPFDMHHRHFGGGQTETTLELPPGPHTLQLLLGDGIHLPHNPAVLSSPITITVK